MPDAGPACATCRRARGAARARARRSTAPRPSTLVAVDRLEERGAERRDAAGRECESRKRVSDAYASELRAVVDDEQRRGRRPGVPGGGQQTGTGMSCRASGCAARVDRLAGPAARPSRARRAACTPGTRPPTCRRTGPAPGAGSPGRASEPAAVRSGSRAGTRAGRPAGGGNRSRQTPSCQRNGGPGRGRTSSWPSSTTPKRRSWSGTAKSTAPGSVRGDGSTVSGAVADVRPIFAAAAQRRFARCSRARIL